MSSTKKMIREAFRNAVFKRDGNKCKICGKTGDLDAHHITDRNEIPNGGYVVENGISLCQEDHEKAEVYHQTNGDEWVEGYHPDELYKRIGSSREVAFEAAKRLALINF